jgi:hypothetical protein
MVTNAKMAPHVIWARRPIAAVSAGEQRLYFPAQKAPPKWGRGLGSRPLFSAGTNGAESRGKRHQIWCPFHPDVTDSPH